MSTIPTIWQRRLAAIENTLGILNERYTDEWQGSRRTETLSMLLANLFSFAREQFNFFHDGLLTRRMVNLLPVVDDPKSAFHGYNIGYALDEHLLSTTLQQIAEDAVVIQRAAEQRDVSNFNLHTLPVPADETDIYFTLAEIDRLTFAGQQMLSGYLPAAISSTVVTYFRRSANVRVIPYAPVALIGIPITAIGLSRDIGVTEDLLAIPHELGHHLYWNGSNDGEPARAERFCRVVPRRLHGSPVAHWAEELFADVISCLVGGPAVARSFLELLLTDIGPRFTDSSDVHPTPELRPYIYGKILEHMGFTVSAQAVRAKWDDILGSRRVYADRAKLFAAYEAVEVIIELLSPQLLAPTVYERWSDDCTYDELYANFKGRLQGLIQDIRMEDLITPAEPIDWRTLGDRLLNGDKLRSLPDDWLAQADERTEVPPALELPLEFSPDEWLTIFEFDGWTTGGPRAGHGGDG
ncbi:MAG: hypothetical protein R2911_00110 [Caldilineaceae bacterium]